MLHFQKREFPPPEEVEWSNLPSEYQYWEKTLGMSPIQDQMGCGSCWSFPAVSFRISFTLSMNFFLSILSFCNFKITMQYAMSNVTTNILSHFFEL